MRTLALVMALLAALPARADELVVLSAAALKGAFADAAQQYHAATGDTVRFVYGTAGGIRDKATAGEPADVVIVPPPPLDALGKSGLVEIATRRDIGAVLLGAGVRTGADTKAFTDEASFKAALLAAPAIGMADPATGATSGIFLAKLLDRLGVTDAVKPKLHLYPEGQVAMEAVARGEAALGLGQVSEIVPVQGVTLLAKLPQSLQLRTIYAGAVATHAHDAAKAAKLLAFLSGPELSAALAHNGFETP